MDSRGNREGKRSLDRAASRQVQLPAHLPWRVASDFVSSEARPIGSVHFLTDSALHKALSSGQLTLIHSTQTCTRPPSSGKYGHTASGPPSSRPLGALVDTCFNSSAMIVLLVVSSGQKKVAIRPSRPWVASNLLTATSITLSYRLLALPLFKTRSR